MEKVNPNEPMKKLEGEQLNEFNSVIESMNLKQLKLARASMKGISKARRTADLRRLYKESKDPENQEKYKKYLEDVRTMDAQVAMFDLYIEKIKAEPEDDEDEEDEETDETVEIPAELGNNNGVDTVSNISDESNTK